MPIRKPAIAALAGILATLALAAPAQATRIKAACTFVGEAKLADKDDPNFGVRFVGGKGSFVFDSLVIVCVGVRDGAPDAQVVGITTQGVYENVVCGTGKVTGTVVRVVGPTKYRNLIEGKKFTIHFIERSGVFFWHHSAKPSLIDLKEHFLSAITRPAGDGSKPTAPKDWQTAGVAQLDEPTQKQPSPPDPATNHCTKAFTVWGFVAIDEDDGLPPVPPKF